VTSPDPALFKEVLGHFATGLVVVTADTPDGPAGFTCQTFGSLSLDPPLVLFAASSSGASWGRVRQSSVVAINVLAADQEAVARLFATSGADKFVDHDGARGPGGSPWLTGALAHLEGRVVGLSTHGDHDVCVVAVTTMRTGTGQPLIYFRGGFRELA
jgi:3-hydroxy-9,10-secoandrosta-1,3,5(10)-triene-9,17-dione monooxygenase reductase component